jgi:hypothetical protein
LLWRQHEPLGRRLLVFSTSTQNQILALVFLFWHVRQPKGINIGLPALFGVEQQLIPYRSFISPSICK